MQLVHSCIAHVKFRMLEVTGCVACKPDRMEDIDSHMLMLKQVVMQAVMQPVMQAMMQALTQALRMLMSTDQIQ